jgi:hypothetical protein
VNAAPTRSELQWQRDNRLEAFDESDLLRESAWVILCSGFRERTVRSVFDHISLSFCDWESSEAIVGSGQWCIRSAAVRFRNMRKLRAILDVSELVASTGFAELKRRICRHPIETLLTLPHIGPVTVWHLAKNLGLNTAKPDRHMVRLTEKLDFCCADHLCTVLGERFGEAPKVVDLVLWRYLADNQAIRSELLG